MEKIYYRLVTKLSNDNEYCETGDIEDFVDLCDLAMYYDIKDNNNKKNWKEHYNSREEAFKNIGIFKVGERFSYKIRR